VLVQPGLASGLQLMNASGMPNAHKRAATTVAALKNLRGIGVSDQHAVGFPAVRFREPRGELPIVGWLRNKRLYDFANGRSDPNGTKSQGIPHDRDRTQAHGNSREHRAEEHAEERIQHASGDRDAEQVIAEGEN